MAMPSSSARDLDLEIRFGIPRPVLVFEDVKFFRKYILPALDKSTEHLEACDGAGLSTTGDECLALAGKAIKSIAKVRKCVDETVHILFSCLSSLRVLRYVHINKEVLRFASSILIKVEIDLRAIADSAAKLKKEANNRLFYVQAVKIFVYVFVPIVLVFKPCKTTLLLRCWLILFWLERGRVEIANLEKMKKDVIVVRRAAQGVAHMIKHVLDSSAGTCHLESLVPGNLDYLVLVSYAVLSYARFIKY